MAEENLTDDQADGADEAPNSNDTFDSVGKTAQAVDVKDSEDESAEASKDESETPKTDGETQTKEGEEAKLTEKGTKLDPNPQSAVHQELANAKRASQDMARLLSDPQALNQYMKEKFGDEATKVAETPEAPKVYKPEDFENLEDVATVVNKLQAESFEKTQALETTVKQLSTAVNSLLSTGKQQGIAYKIEQDVASLRNVPELDPKSPEFIEGLETDIADMYHKLDFDEKTGSYSGQHSMAEIAKAMIEASKKAKAKGSEKAQTVVKDKTAGKVTTSPKVSEKADTDKLDPSSSIAEGISRTFR